MYAFLSNPLTDLIIQELRRYWSYHPKFVDLVDNIQGKHSWRERPARGVVVRPGGGQAIRLSSDNYIGLVHSYVGLAQVRDFPGVSLEWVREDSTAIRNNEGVFPSPPGYYYVTITHSDLDALGSPTGMHEFTVSPNLRKTDEGVEMVSSTEGFLSNLPLAGSLRLYEMPSNTELFEDTDYTWDMETGQITLTDSLPTGLYLSADYTYAGEESGPWVIQEDRAHYEAIPGVVLAFGRRITPGDQMCVQIVERREPVAEEFGGRWTVSVELEIWSKDVDTTREIHDSTAGFINGVLRAALSSRGVEIESTSLGGEGEDQYDSSADDWFYTANLSFECQTDWSLHKPLVARLQRVDPLPYSQIQELAGLSDEDLVLVESNIKLLANLNQNSWRDPFFSNLRERYPSIK